MNNTFEFNYSKFSKGAIILGLSYAFANNAIQNITFSDSNRVNNNTYENSGNLKRLGLSGNFNYPVSKRLSVNANGNLYRVWTEGLVQNQFYRNTGFQGSAFASANYRINATLRLGISGGYTSANIRLQGETKFSYYTATSLSKTFLSRKLTASASLSNPFSRFRRWEKTTTGADFYEYAYFNNYFRSYNLGITYRFGKLKDELKKNSKSINNDDVKKLAK